MHILVIYLTMFGKSNGAGVSLSFPYNKQRKQNILCTKIEYRYVIITGFRLRFHLHYFYAYSRIQP